jgi:hypothetical protein
MRTKSPRNVVVSLRTKFPRGVITSQTIGNIGLYYTCYRLSLFGWNVMPTARNAKGIDIVIFSQHGHRKRLIQVKTLSKKNPVPLGESLENLFADFVVVCVRAHPNEPDCFVLTPDEVRKFARKGVKNGKTRYWLKMKGYYRDQFKQNWMRIGSGAD